VTVRTTPQPTGSGTFLSFAAFLEPKRKISEGDFSWVEPLKAKGPDPFDILGGDVAPRTSICLIIGDLENSSGAFALSMGPLSWLRPFSSVNAPKVVGPNPSADHNGSLSPKIDTAKVVRACDVE
jgi:hypothetical protein